MKKDKTKEDVVEEIRKEAKRLGLHLGYANKLEELLTFIEDKISNAKQEFADEIKKYAKEYSDERWQKLSLPEKSFLSEESEREWEYIITHINNKEL